MRRQSCGFMLVLTIVAGCENGPHKGTTYSMDHGGSFYLDENLFRAAVDRQTAGESVVKNENQEMYNSGRLAFLDEGDEVRIVESVPGGARVVVTDGDRKGQIGWMLASDLKEPAKK